MMLSLVFLLLALVLIIATMVSVHTSTNSARAFLIPATRSRIEIWQDRL